MTIMATSGALYQEEGKGVKQFWRQNRIPRTTTFKYAKPVEYQFRYRHAMDDHNSLQHAVASLEGTWQTRQWPIRVFSFLLAISHLALHLQVPRPQDCPQVAFFHYELAWQFIDIKYIKSGGLLGDSTEARSKQNEHVLGVAPHHVHCHNGCVWVLGAKNKYQQYQCKWLRCKEYSCHFCACNSSVWLCSYCHVEHVIDCMKAKNQSSIILLPPFSSNFMFIFMDFQPLTCFISIGHLGITEILVKFYFRWMSSFFKIFEIDDCGRK